MTVVAPIELVKAFVLSRASIADCVGDRVWLNMEEPPKGWTPECGDGLIIMTRGGQAHNYIDKLATESYYFRCYPGAKTPVAAERLCTLIGDAIHNCANLPVEIDGKPVAWLVLCQRSGVIGVDFTKNKQWPYFVAAFDFTISRE